MSIFGYRKTQMVTAEDALPGRETAMRVPARHEVLGTQLAPPYPEGTRGRRVRARLLLGRGKELLADSRGRVDRRRI